MRLQVRTWMPQHTSPKDNLGLRAALADLLLVAHFVCKQSCDSAELL